MIGLVLLPQQRQRDPLALELAQHLGPIRQWARHLGGRGRREELRLELGVIEPLEQRPGQSHEPRSAQVLTHRGGRHRQRTRDLALGKTGLLGQPQYLSNPSHGLPLVGHRPPRKINPRVARRNQRNPASGSVADLDSGARRKTVQFAAGITVQFGPDSVSSFGRNRRPVWSGIRSVGSCALRPGRKLPRRRCDGAVLRARLAVSCMAVDERIREGDGCRLARQAGIPGPTGESRLSGKRIRTWHSK